MRDAQIGLDERIEACRVDRRTELGEDAAHETEMDGADDLAVGLGCLAERAVVQQYPPRPTGGDRFGREADVVEDSAQLLGRRSRVDPAKWRRPVREVSSL